MAKVHFIGAGQMAEAIIRASLSNGTLRADAISLEDIDSARIEALHSRYRLSGDGSLSEASLLVLGIRPQDDLAAVASRVRAQLNGSTTVVSLIAGVTTETLASLFGEATPIVRTIPNTLTDTGFGYSGVTLNAHASAAEIEPFLRGFGKVLYLPERLIDVLPVLASRGLTIFTTLLSPLLMPAYWRGCRGLRRRRWCWRTCSARSRCCAKARSIRVSFWISIIHRRESGSTLCMS